MFQVVRCYPLEDYTGLDDLFANGEIGDWWRFDSENTTVGAVSQLIDTATGIVNGRVLSQSTEANRPILTTVSGTECAHFGNGSDYLIHSLGSTVAQPGTIIISIADTATSTHPIITGSSSSSRWQINNDSDDDIIAYAGAELDSGFNAPIGTKVLTVEFNGASSKFRRNGVQTASGNAGSQSTNQITIGALWDGSFPGDFSVWSLLFIDRILTASELDRAERLLGGHAGLSW
jgi:hypothetical protein